MSRPTPYHLVFAPLEAELDGLGGAAARAGLDPLDRSAFGRLPEARRLLERLEGPDLVARDPAAADAYLALLHAAYRFREAGGRLVAPERARLESLVAAPPAPRPPVVPGGACYLQLPERWFWARADDAGPHEPLDGCFTTVARRGEEVSVVAILGLRAERGGFTQVALHVAPNDFVAARDTRRDPPFAPLMDGGAAAGFRSVATAGELLDLVSLALAATDR